MYVNYFDAPAGCERWQVLSPFRGRAYGTVQLNRYLKETYRRAEMEAATRRVGRRVPAPLGPERIVLGDKVVNLVNRSLRFWSREEGQQTGYVANGEIGVVIGQIKSKSMKSPPWMTQVEYASQPGRRYRATSGSGDGDAPVELAWALTVHKSQGSEFGFVVLMLPAGVRRLSRELLYTALTRQTDRVVVCHEGPLDELLEMTRATGSDTGRRLTDLVRVPLPMQVRTATGESAGLLDAGLVHVTDGGILVRSKNEVIIAGLLDELAPGAWAYEQPLEAPDGTRRLPDFTVTAADGRVVYWEHLGMLEDPAYAAAWERKKQWYASMGVLPADEGGGPAGALMWTDDLGGVNVPAWRAAAEAVIGRPRSGGRPGGRAAKKAAARRLPPSPA